MKTLAVIQLTFRESFAKKTFMAFFGISTLVCLIFLFALNLDIVDGMKSSISLFGKQSSRIVDLERILRVLEGGVAILLFTGGLFLSLFATSSLIPNMLQSGNIDVLISKPLSRTELLAGKYLGAVAIVAFNIFYLIIFSWLILSFKTGIWNGGFLFAGVMIVITFAVLYALMTFLGLVTGSGPFSLMLTYLILFFSPLLLQRDKIYALLSNKIYGQIVDGLYYLLPKTAELGNLTRELVQGSSVTSWMPLWSSILFGIITFGISSLIFQNKNF